MHAQARTHAYIYTYTVVTVRVFVEEIYTFVFFLESELRGPVTTYLQWDMRVNPNPSRLPFSPQP